MTPCPACLTAPPGWLLLLDARNLQVAACAALTNIPYIERVRDALLSERARLFEQLQAVSWLEPYPSQANFILCKVLEVGADGGSRPGG